MARVVAFGEIMLRLAPEGMLRLGQVLPGSLQVTFAGAEANLAASLAMLGDDVAFVTALPDGPVSDACVNHLRGLGVDTSGMIRTERGRLGMFYVETGANQRPSRVIYDRDFSAISLACAEDFDWGRRLQGAEWLHITGITAALSAEAARNTIQAAVVAQSMGIRVSCDVNFRSRLWRWDPLRTPQQLASDTLQELVRHVDLLLTGAEDAALLGVPFRASSAQDAVANARGLAEAVRATCPTIRYVVCSLRECVSASHNNWGATLFDGHTRRLSVAPQIDGKFSPYEIRNIVDRVGGGDAFAAGLLYAMGRADFADDQAALEFATAAGCLAHSIVGDFNYSSRSEVDELMRGSRSGRVVR